MVEDIPIEDIISVELDKQTIKHLVMEGLVIEVIRPDGQPGYWVTEKGLEWRKNNPNV